MPFFRKKAITKKKRTVKRKPTANVKLIKKVVKAAIHREVENKTSSLVFPLTAFNSAADLFGDCIFVLPLILQGTQESGRIGSSITARSLSIKGHINSIPANADATRARVMVRMMIVQPKAFRNLQTAQANFTSWLGRVLRNGNTEMGLNGSIESLYLPANHEVVTVLADRKITLMPDYFIGSSLATRLITKFFTINLKVKQKKLVYSEGTPSYPMGYAPILLFSYCYLDGSAPSDLSTALQMSFVSTLSYEDA